MKSVDALRELGSQYHDRIIFFKEEFDKCLGAIEEEGKTRYGTEYTDELYQFARRVEVAANDRDDVTLFGVDYTPLPVDADGVSIHVGDVMENIVCPPVHREVTGVGVECFYGWDDGNGRYSQFDANCYRHHHAPTVEDVLREFAYGLGVPVADSYVAATAAKLRLAGDE